MLTKCMIAVVVLCISSQLWAADNRNDYNTHRSLDDNQLPTGSVQDPAPHNCHSSTSPVDAQSGEFLWSDTDIVLAGRPALYLTRHYRSLDTREGIFGKGWSTRCEKALLRVIGFTDRNGEATTEPVVKYVYRTENGKRYEYVETTPNVFAKPDGLPGRTLVLQDIEVPQIVYINGSTETYNALGQLIAETDRNGNTVNYTYEDGALVRMADTYGRYLELLYDSTGHVTTVSDHTGRSWIYNYNADGTLADVTDPAGGALRYTYTPVTRAFDAQIYPSITEVKDESGVVTVSVEYGETGRVNSYTMGENTYTYTQETIRNVFYEVKTDSLESTWYFVTDELGRKTSVFPPIFEDIAIQYTYDENSNITQYSDLAGTNFSSTYDELGRVTSSTTPDGTSRLNYQGDTAFVSEIISNTGRSVRVEYDSRGNPLRITDPVGNVSTLQWNTSGDLTSSSDPLGNTATQLYNAIGLVTRATDPLNRSTGFAYDALGNLTSITDAAGSITSMEYDVLDRLISTTDALGHITQYSYDAAGRLLTVIDAAGGSTIFAYDVHGRLASETRSVSDTESMVFTYTYRADNLLDTMTDPRGVVMLYTYDDGKRMTQVDAGTNRYTYTYDVQGRVVSASSNASRLAYTYDALHRVITETQDGRTTTYTYNAESELVGLNYENEDLTYTYDDRGLLTVFATPSGTHRYVHDASGRLTSHSRPNGNTALMTYDAAYQLLKQDYSQVSGEVFQYSYDNLGRITQIVGDGNADWAYRYDAIHRLIGADHEQAYAYQYDALGNRIENGGVYDLFNKLLEDNEFTYSYDEMGSLISKVEKTNGEMSRYGYDGFARMSSFERTSSAGTLPTTSASYGYDPFGRRVLKDVDGDQTRFQWKGNDLIAEHDGSSANTAIYRYDGGYTAAEYTESTTTFDVLSDYLGSAKRLTNQDSIIQWSSQIGPYGDEISSGITSVNAIDFRQRFPGQYHDDETNLSYNLNRYYASDTGHYISADRIGIFGGLNHYRYATASPTSAIDPNGLAVTPETALDAASIVLSAAEFANCKTLANGLWLAADIVGAIVPILPSPGIIRHGGKILGAKTARGSGLGGYFKKTENASGGQVYLSNGVIAQNDFVSYVDGGLYRGDNIEIISGAHGFPDGSTKADYGMLKFDVDKFGSLPGVTVHDVNKLSKKEMTDLLEGPGTIIGGFCNSAACLNKK